MIFVGVLRGSKEEGTGMSEMKDWPVALRKNAAICALAKALFAARAEAYGGNSILTDAPAHVRQRFMELAQAQVEGLDPSDREGTRREEREADQREETYFQKSLKAASQIGQPWPPPRSR